MPLAKEGAIALNVLNAGKYIEAWDEFNLEGVPAIIHFREGKEVSRIVGVEEKDVYKNWFLEIKRAFLIYILCPFLEVDQKT